MPTPIKRAFDNTPMLPAGTGSMEKSSKTITFFEDEFDVKCDDVVATIKGRILISTAIVEAIQLGIWHVEREYRGRCQL